MKLSKEVKENLKIIINEAFDNIEDAKYIRRIDILTLIVNGKSINEVSEMFNISRKTISSWIRKIRENGMEGIKDKPGRGLKQTITEELKIKIKEDISLGPNNFGYDVSKWDGKLVSHHLKLKYNIDLKVRRCQYLLKEFGFSPSETKAHT